MQRLGSTENTWTCFVGDLCKSHIYRVESRPIKEDIIGQAKWISKIIRWPDEGFSFINLLMVKGRLRLARTKTVQDAVLLLRFVLI